MSRGDGGGTASTMVSAPEGDPREGHQATTASIITTTTTTTAAGDFPSKLPSAKHLLAAATSPLDRELPELASAGRRSDAGPSPKSLQAETPDALPPSSYRRDYVVPVSSPPVNGGQHHASSSMHRQQALAPSPSHPQAEMEAAQRAQADAHYHRLVDLHTGDIRSLGEALAQLDHNIRLLMQDMQDVRRELRGRGAPPPPAGQVDDRTLEILSSNLNQVTNKANEVDGIKVELALLKRKVARLEEQSQIASPTSGSAQYPHREPAHHGPSNVAPHMHPQHTLPSIPPISTLAAPHHPLERRVSQQPGSAIDHPTPRSAEQRTHSLPGTHSLDTDTPLSAGGGWTTVNQGAKRPSDVNGRMDTSGTPLGSPKRPKLAPLEPRMPSNESMHLASSYGDHRELPHLRPQSTESGFDPKQPHHPHHHLGHPPPQDLKSDGGWRAEPHRPLPPFNSVGTSPTRGGRAGRGRGGRRSGQEHELVTTTPEWERDSWQPPQIGPEGYYQPITPSGRGRGILRRGSGGAHPHPGTQHQASASASAAAAAAAATVMIQPGDPYAHTKKQRQKPTRNADGILIRKDGRPDMRSQSSAANLRKVHARKEEERQREWEATQPVNSPTGGSAVGPTAASLSAMPSRSASADSQDEAEAQIQGEKTEEQERHEQVMKQMFPRGVDDSRSRLYGLGGDAPSDGPLAAPRKESGDSVRANETQPSTAAVSAQPTPDPVERKAAPEGATETQDTPMGGTEAEKTGESRSAAAPIEPTETATTAQGASQAAE